MACCLQILLLLLLLLRLLRLLLLCHPLGWLCLQIALA
jgi:hypothetical protein